MITYPIWMKAILFVEDTNNAQELSHKLYVTYSNLTKILSEFEEKGWITRITKGREKRNKLTSKGKKIQQATQIILEELNGLNVKR